MRNGLVGLVIISQTVKFTGNLSVRPSAVYASPPPFCPLPLAQWFETVHANDVVSHLDELKSVITSTFGRILKLDSTKKVHISRISFLIVVSSFNEMIP